MKYKVGDRVKIREDLLVGNHYDEWLLTEEMQKDIESNDYVLTISKAYIAYDEKTPVYCYEEDTHRANGQISNWELTEAMIEGLVELTDREKFENWMRQLSSLEGWDERWDTFNNLTALEPDDYGYNENLKLVADYLFNWWWLL